MITIDTLRRDHLGCYGYFRKTSPFIDKLAQKGVKFEHVITPITATSGSHASILTSLHPVTHNVTNNGDILNRKVQTMAEVLQQNGYYTIGAIAVKILSAKYNFSQGFDSFSDQWNENEHFNTPSQRTARSINESLFKQIAEYRNNHSEKPLFMWVHYYDPHTPYRQIDHITFRKKLQRTTNREPVNRYDKEIHYTDEHIKELYDHLEATGIAKKMVTCITADHGEQFGEHGYYNCHGDFYSETTLVPLIFSGYDISRNKVFDEYISTMDIPVTLLKRVNLSFDSPVEGIDLLAAGKHSQRRGKRNFLIMGYPAHTKSLQLLSYPFAFILNLDYHFKH
ncbi:sulfatase [Acidobacteriota bacterium]